jgi:sec-independent protein translocase protein TatA
MIEGLLQPTHLFLVLAVALIVFGPGKLPDLGKALGESVRELKKALQEGSGNPAAGSTEKKSETTSQPGPGDPSGA